MVKVSIIVPIYNVEDYLEMMLESIISQNYDNYELLLVDDGSTDRSGALCDQFADKYERVRVFHIKNGGASRARNFGLRQAAGEYIHFADSDDLIEAGMYVRFNEIAETYHPDIIMCGSLQINLARNRQTVVAPEKELYLKERHQIATYLDDIPMEEMHCLIHYIWNKWYKKDFLVKNYMLFSSELRLGEDYVFNCEAIRAVERLYVMPQTYYHYYIRGNSLVSAFQPEPWKSRQMLFDAHKALYESYGLWDSNEKAIKMEEGKMCFAALRSMNSKRCRLSSEEKITFLKRFSSSMQMELALYYLENSGKKLHRLWRFLIQRCGLLGIRIVLLADYVQRMG